MPFLPKKYNADLFLRRSFKQLAIRKWGGLFTASLSSSYCNYEDMNQFRRALHRCHTAVLTFTGDGKRSPRLIFLIIIQSSSLSMILCFCFTNRSTQSLSADCATSILSRSTRKEGIPCMCSTVPPRSPILPSSSKIHCLSLSLGDHYRHFYDWSEHSDGCMVLLFLRILLYLCIIHHHNTTLLKESGLKLFLCAWGGGGCHY